MNAINSSMKTIPAATLSRQQKAAIVVRFLMNEGADINLSNLPPALQANLTREIADLRLVDRATLGQVIEEFANELDAVGFSARGGLGEALKLLDGKITPQTAKKLREDAGVRLFEDPWDRIKGLDIDDLIDILDQETAEVAAVVLSKLDVPQAAIILAQMPGERARRITYAISMTGSVTPLAVDRIGQCILSQIDNRPELAFVDLPESRIAAILTAANDTLRDEVLQGLRDTDAPFAERVERSVFTFDIIPDRIAQNDIPKAIKTVPQSDLVTAFAFARTNNQSEIVDYMMAAMSKRMVDRIEEEIQDLGKVTRKDGQAAIAMLVNGIQSQISAGELSFIFNEVEED
jgi:flagellar motor switch protein FliG